MFTPSASRQDIVDYVVEVARLAGSNPCPPMVLGVGIGGDFELCAYLAKKALCRNVSEGNPEYRFIRKWSGIFSKLSTSWTLDHKVLVATRRHCPWRLDVSHHIAGLPVAVNVGCHVTRHKNITI